MLVRSVIEIWLVLLVFTSNVIKAEKRPEKNSGTGVSFNRFIRKYNNYESNKLSQVDDNDDDSDGNDPEANAYGLPVNPQITIYVPQKSQESDNSPNSNWETNTETNMQWRPVTEQEVKSSRWLDDDQVSNVGQSVSGDQQYISEWPNSVGNAPDMQWWANGQQLQGQKNEEPYYYDGAERASNQVYANKPGEDAIWSKTNNNNNEISTTSSQQINYSWKPQNADLKPPAPKNYDDYVAAYNGYVEDFKARQSKWNEQISNYYSNYYGNQAYYYNYQQLHTR